MDTVTELTFEDAESRANSSEALEFTPTDEEPEDKAGTTNEDAVVPSDFNVTEDEPIPATEKDAVKDELDDFQPTITEVRPLLESFADVQTPEQLSQLMYAVGTSLYDKAAVSRWLQGIQ